MGSCLGVPPPPEVDLEKIGATVAEKSVDVVKKAHKNYEKFQSGMEKANGKPFPVPDCGKLTLTSGKDGKAEVLKAAFMAAFSGEFRNELVELVWGELKPELSEQLGDEVPARAKNMCLKSCRKKVVVPAVNKAVDEVIEKAQAEMAGDADGGEEKAADDKKGQKKEEAKKKRGGGGGGDDDDEEDGDGGDADADGNDGFSNEPK